ncbi:MAG: class I SAM-dependent methyltransferase [bacterium]|jgi:2-polyprenyl-6-hydroxyphenyl methylase/3-demethylubiquinone-9 3-methyltransferase
MGYYSENLAGIRLKQCYDIAPPRVRQYLEAEIKHVLSRLGPGDSVLELGCGYGRVTREIAREAGRVVGIDTAAESLKLAGDAARAEACEYFKMDATDLDFDDDEFDMVVCVQNGICAFGVDRETLVKEAIRVTRPGGRILFSTYSGKFWAHRLRWFELQAEHGLVGEIDYEASGGGVIACKDGFRAGAMGEEDFRGLCARIGVEFSITEVDESSVFCELIKPRV